MLSVSGFGRAVALDWPAIVPWRGPNPLPQIEEKPIYHRRW
jgi:hypothetical protein